MVIQKRNILTESEINSIRGQYGLNPLRRNYIFEACVSVDGRYFVIRDDVFDIQEQRTIGNIWDSLDNFKTIFTNVKVEDETGEFDLIKEGILSLPIIEGIDNLYQVRDYLLEFNFFDDTWLGSKLKQAGKSIGDDFEKGFRGLKKMGVMISHGEWSKLWSLLKRGVKWILRELKSAMYSTIGITVDAILVATGIGKGVQWIPWALILGLDIYQMSTNDWPAEDASKPTWLKWLDIGFDIMGLVFAGMAAKGAKQLFAPLRNLGEKGSVEIVKFLERNPTAKGMIEKMISGIQKVPKLLNEAVTLLKNKFPAGSEFIQKMLGGLSNILSKLSSMLNGLLGGTVKKLGTVGGSGKFGKGLRSGAIATGIGYGAEKLSPSLASSSAIKQDPYQEMLKYGDNVRIDPNSLNI